ncbi:hypothetical protein B0H10DRAFT_2206607 [Mycena sp. CBHHK59/15]|nr:hypothetical protein B0H10DRAFT_2206607 [Mycena sp. CBHHK59/15]
MPRRKTLPAARTPPRRASASPSRDAGVKGITRKVIRTLEGLGHLVEADDDEDDEEEVERVLADARRAGKQRAAVEPPAEKKKVDWEVPRKVFHSSIGFITLSLYLTPSISPRAVTLVLWSALAVIAPTDFVRLRVPAVERVYERALGFLMRESERHSTNGTLWYILGVNFALTFYPIDVATVAILMCVLPFLYPPIPTPVLCAHEHLTPPLPPPPFRLPCRTSSLTASAYYWPTPSMYIPIPIPPFVSLFFFSLTCSASFPLHLALIARATLPQVAILRLRASYVPVHVAPPIRLPSFRFPFELLLGVLVAIFYCGARQHGVFDPSTRALRSGLVLKGMLLRVTPVSLPRHLLRGVAAWRLRPQRTRCSQRACAEVHAVARGGSGGRRGPSLSRSSSPPFPLRFVLSRSVADPTTSLSWADTAASTVGRLYGPRTRPLPAALPLPLPAWMPVPAFLLAPALPTAPTTRRLKLPFAPRKSTAGFLAACATGALVALVFWGSVAGTRVSAPMPPPAFAEGWVPSWVQGWVGHVWDAVGGSASGVGGSEMTESQTTPERYGVRGAGGLLVLAVCAGLVSGVAEALDLGGLDDNLTLPIISGGALMLFFRVWGWAVGAAA